MLEDWLPLSCFLKLKNATAEWDGVPQPWEGAQPRPERPCGGRADHAPPGLSVRSCRVRRSNWTAVHGPLIFDFL